MDADKDVALGGGSKFELMIWSWEDASTLFCALTVTVVVYVVRLDVTVEAEMLI